MKSHLEVEVTYAPDDDSLAPDLAALDGVEEVRPGLALSLSAVYFDTADFVLLRAGVTLRRRTGGPDEGWHLKVPAGSGREELHRPLGRSAATPPKALRDLVAGWTRGASLAPVATVDTHRSPTLLVDSDQTVLAEFVDDRVTGTTPDGKVVKWREWELELVDGTGHLFKAADDAFASLGVKRAPLSRKVARVIGDRVPAAPRLRTPKPGKPVSRLVHVRLAEQVNALGRRDVEARQGTDEGVHKMRVACRRLRSLLATFRPVLDRDQIDLVREELRWLAGVLGQARDATVVHKRLRGLVADEPRNQVQGPVLRRLRTTYHGRGKPEVLAALDAKRYFDLRAQLDQLVADPPWTEAADAPARDVVREVLRKEFKRFRKHARAAADVADADSGDALHDARKAAKRVRYAAETVEPVVGRPARRLVRGARKTTSHLGELQDTTIARTDLLALSKSAHAAGEPTFTYGRLHAREETRADELTTTFRVHDVVARMKGRTGTARKATRQK